MPRHRYFLALRNVGCPMKIAPVGKRFRIQLEKKRDFANPGRSEFWCAWDCTPEFVISFLFMPTNARIGIFNSFFVHFVFYLWRHIENWSAFGQNCRIVNLFFYCVFLLRYIGNWSACGQNCRRVDHFLGNRFE